MLGFSLAEIKTLLSLDEGDCDQTKRLAATKLDDVKRKIKDLSAIANTLEALISACEGDSTDTSCPIIEAISQGE